MVGGALAALVALVLAQPLGVEDALRAAETRARAGEAREALADVRHLLERMPTGEPLRPRVLHAIAVLEGRLGEYASAATHAAEAARLFEQHGDGRRGADARNTAGLAELNGGRYPEAIASFQAALVGSAAARDASGQSEQLSNLGNVYYFLGRYGDAADSYARAAAVVNDHRDEPWASRRRRIILANEAALHQRLGRYHEALALYDEMAATASDMRPEEQAQVLINQGVLYRRLGDPYKALDAYQAARSTFTTHRHLEGELGAITNRGIVLALDLQAPGEARQAFGEALALAIQIGSPREQLLARLYRGEAALRGNRLDEAAADFEASRAGAEGLEAREEEWKALYGLGRVRARTGDATGARDALDRAIGIVDGLRETLTLPSSRADFFQDKRDVYDARIALGLRTEPVALVFDLLERSRARAWRDRLGLVGAVQLDAVQRALPEDTVLLSYWYGAPGAAVVRVTRQSAAVHPLEVEAASLGQLARALRQPDTDDWLRAATEVARALLPADVLGGARRLVVVPDGPLGLVPFEVLPVDGSSLVSRVSVRYLPTAAALVAPAASRAAWRWPWSATLAAFGDPLPGADGWSASAATPRLPATADEVRDVARLLGGSHAIFTGANNVKERVRGALEAHPLILHAATHGVADSVAPERSRLLFSPSTPGGPAGSLFLREVYDLPLDGVELAVLSACDTESGPVLRGEGVQGFGRALLAAGARTAVTTLWRVPDHAAASLMRVFYDRLQRGDDRAAALASAKRALMASGTLAHPHYWAAFVLSGDGGAVPRAPRWRTIGGVVSVLMGLVLAIVAYRRRR